MPFRFENVLACGAACRKRLRRLQAFPLRLFQAAPQATDQTVSRTQLHHAVDIVPQRADQFFDLQRSVLRLGRGEQRRVTRQQTVPRVGVRALKNLQKP